MNAHKYSCRNLGDISRFPSADNCAAYLGLEPLCRVHTD